MPRKKKESSATIIADAADAVITASNGERQTAAVTRPAYIDGPPVDEHGKFIQSPSESDEQMHLPTQEGSSEAKHWGPPYKAILTSKTIGFEMGEDRRFKQRVFKFAERPADEVLAKLKDCGFTYRANEKAWTIEANPETRKISDSLARELAGEAQLVGRT